MIIAYGNGASRFNENPRIFILAAWATGISGFLVRAREEVIE